MHLDPITILAGLTVLVSIYAWSNQAVMSNLILDPYQMNRSGGQWYRLLTSGFLHADWGHLIFNMITFYSFGGVVLATFSQFLGSTAGLVFFLVLYLGGIVLSDLPTYFRHRHDPGYRSLGASGGVSSVLFSSILLYPTSRISVMFLPGMPSFLFGFLYLAYSYYMGRRRGDNINHDAHFYGALYGVVLTIGLLPATVPEFMQKVTYYLSNLLNAN